MEPGPRRSPGPISRLDLARRSAVIVGVVLKHGVRWWIGWLGLLIGFAGRARRKAWFGEVVLDSFRELGATFVKVGQIMSTRPDLLPEHITRALEHLQDDVGPFPFEAAARIIEQDFGRPTQEIFAELGPVPIASASVSQVHKARLHDGRLVAIKVRRPKVTELCAFDLAVMRQVARFLEIFPALRSFSPLAAVEEFGGAIYAQLDFTIEARNNQRFRANFAGHSDVVFPTLIEDLCSERVLTMSFIEGTKILSIRGTRLDAKRIARLGLQVLLKMVFEDGFVHADLHPGNIFITPEERIALLDLGLVGILSDPHRKAFARFFAAWAKRDGDEMAHLMYAMSANANGPRDPEAFERYRAAIIDFVGRYWGQRLGDVQLGKVLFDLSGILRRHRIRANASFTTVNIAIAVTEGIGKQLDPSLDLITEALPYFLSHPIMSDAAGT
jgi:ubiquinone biosynthesis protein